MTVDEAYAKIDLLATDIVSKVIAIYGDGFQVSDVADGAKVLIEIIKTTEQIVDGSGKDKIKFEAELLDKVITFSGWSKILELFDGKLIKIILSYLVELLNKYIGKDWLDKIEDNWDSVEKAIEFIEMLAEYKVLPE